MNNFLIITLLFMAVSVQCFAAELYELVVKQHKNSIKVHVRNISQHDVKCVLLPRSKKDVERKVIVNRNSTSEISFSFRTKPKLKCWPI